MSNTSQRRTRALLLAAALASPLMVALPTQQANAQSFDLRIGTPPPPPRVVAVPAPRSGYVYTPGYWRWNGRRHVWADGRYVRERPGYRWDEARWDRDGDRYGFHRGGWVRN